MKTCSHCKAEKPRSEYRKDSGRKDGLYPQCKVCHSEAGKRWVLNNSEKRAAISRDWSVKNRERRNEITARWRADNKDAAKAATARWREENREYLRSYQVGISPARAAREGLRRATKLKATPSWANLFFIEEAYHLAKLREQMLGGEWHVDHIVPLQGKTVCGLHVENNLQVIPALQNLRKHNSVWPDMP